MHPERFDVPDTEAALACLAKISDEQAEFWLDEAETALQEFLGVKCFALAASGLSSLEACLRAAGVREGDEVICDALFPFAAMATCNVGGVPVTADIDSESLTLAPVAVARVVGPRTRAVIATAAFGVPPDARALRTVLATRPDIRLIEDHAQAFGVQIGGARIAAGAELAAFSFQRGKPLSCGYGGGVASSEKAMDEQVRRYLCLGWYPRRASDGSINWEGAWQQRQRGASARLSPLAAALLLRRLRGFPLKAMARIAIAQRIAEALAKLPGVRVQRAPVGFDGQRWKVAALVSDSRLTTALAARDAQLFRWNTPPVSDWPCFRSMSIGELPNTRAAATELVLFSIDTEEAGLRNVRAVLELAEQT